MTDDEALELLCAEMMNRGPSPVVRSGWTLERIDRGYGPAEAIVTLTAAAAGATMTKTLRVSF